MYSSPRNPYAPPQAALYDKTPSVCWRKGKLLVVPRGHTAPERCVKCNEPAELGKPRRFAWHHPGWYLFIPVNLLVYAIITLFVQKKARVAFGLCAAHRGRLRHVQLGACALLVLGLMLLLSGARGDADSGFWVALAGGVMLLAAFVVAIVGGQVLRPARIDGDEAHLKGCGAAFLDSLPAR